MKKLVTLTLALVLSLSLAVCLSACGGGGGGEDDPNAGMYVGDQIYVFEWEPMSDYYTGETYIELEGNGDGTFALDGEKAPMSWTLEGENITIDVGGEKATGTLKDGTITVNDLFGMGDVMVLTFTKEAA